MSSSFLFSWRSTWLVLDFLSSHYLCFQLVYQFGWGKAGVWGGEFNFLKSRKLARIEIKLIYSQPLLPPKEIFFLTCRLKIQRSLLLFLLSVLILFWFFSLCQAYISWISVNPPMCLLSSSSMFSLKTSVSFSSAFLESVSSMLSTSLIWFSACWLCPFLIPVGILFLCWHFFLWLPYILSYVNESSFNSVPFSTYWFHHHHLSFFLFAHSF